MGATGTADGRAGLLGFARRRPGLASAASLLAVWGGVSAWLAADFSGRVRDWAVMTDELLYTKLAISVADTGSPVPRVHDTVVGVINQLYPLLLAPFFAASDVPGAFHAAHVFNAPLMASACIPAYLVARQVVSRPWALAVAALSVTVPWMVLVGVLMTEPAAYPAFLWAVFACLYAVRSPGRRGDLLAVTGLVLAILARTQFVVLAIVLPLAVLADALVFETEGPPRRRLVRAAVSSVRRHPLLATAYAAAGGVAVGVAIVGSLGDALGVYGTTLHGSILPSSVWGAAAAHLDDVAVGCGLLPLLLGGGWMLATTARPRGDRPGHRLAVFGLLTTVALTLETASFDVRFGGEQIVRDRYLFYVVPLLLAGSAAALARGRPRPVAVGAAALAVFFASTVHLLDFPRTIAFWVDSPERILNGWIADASGSMSTAAFAALAGAVLGLAVVIGVLTLPGRLVAVAALAFLLPFTVLATRDEIDTVARTNSTSGRPFTGSPGVVLDWMDRVLPGGTRVGMIPFPQSPEFPVDALLWWDVEFWNRTASETFVAPSGNFSYAPFPNRVLAPDWTTGRIAGTSGAPPFVVFSLSDARFRLAGVRHAENLGLEVLLADRPYRAQWATRGLDQDGWGEERRPATIRVYAEHAQPERADLSITLDAPPGSAARFELGSGNGRLAGDVPAAAAVTESLSVCVPGGSHADVPVVSSSGASIPGVPLSFEPSPARRVGVRVGPIEVTFTGRACAAR